jgi:hypothetical protein
MTMMVLSLTVAEAASADLNQAIRSVIRIIATTFPSL